RVLSVQALLRDLPVYPRSAAGVADRLSAAHAPVADRARRRAAEVRFRPPARTHRSAGRRRDRARTNCERERPVEAGSGAHGEGNGDFTGAVAADVRTRAVLEVVPPPPEAGRRARACTGGVVPD